MPMIVEKKRVEVVYINDEDKKKPDGAGTGDIEANGPLAKGMVPKNLYYKTSLEPDMWNYFSYMFVKA